MSAADPRPSQGGALAGLRVLDLTRYIPGPYCTMLLGDLGAEVIKVEEPPIGDPTRVVPPAAGEDSAVHAALNRNKRSVVVDLRRAEGAAVVRKIAASADVFVEGFRPGAMTRRGLGPEALCSAHPRLVYCSVTGYGQSGPLSSRAGHDINYAARAGFLGTNVDASGRPVLPLTQVADMAGAFAAVIGILAALQARERTGCGQVVDTSMFDATAALMTVPLTRLAAGMAGAGELSGSHASYNVYRCRDGRYLAVGALEPKFWGGLCRALELPEKVRRQWERDPADRQATMESLAGVFLTRDRDAWISDLDAHDVCVEPVLDGLEALTESRRAGAILEQPTPDGFVATVRPPVRLSGTPVTVRRRAPALAEHSDEVLAEAGYAAAEIEALRVAGVVA